MASFIRNPNLPDPSTWHISKGQKCSLCGTQKCVVRKCYDTKLLCGFMFVVCVKDHINIMQFGRNCRKEFKRDTEYTIELVRAIETTNYIAYEYLKKEISKHPCPTVESVRIFTEDITE